MALNYKQEQGLKIAVERYRHKEKYTVISGYAGSGKTFLVKKIIEEIGVPQDKVCFATYTGKAAQVLIDRGNKNVKTLHRLLYNNKQQEDGTFLRTVKESLSEKVIIIDECSMIPLSMVEILFGFSGIYIIFLGDPGQLPPIESKEKNHLLAHPHIFLDEIVRQGKDSDIINLSMLIRENKPTGFYKGKDVMVISKKDYCSGMLEWADQILCATNDYRIAINNRVRELKGFIAPIEDGENLICLKNNWDIESENKNPLTNGVIGQLSNIREGGIFYNKSCAFGLERNKTVEVLRGDFESETGDSYGRLLLDKNCIITGEPILTPKDYYAISRSKYYRRSIPLQFTYGYAITGWKAQGSQWDKVLIFEERFPFDREEHKKFLYTCVTRAMKKVILVR